MTVHLVLVGHGSRSAQANEEFEALVRTYAARRPDLACSGAYIELAKPSLLGALCEAARTSERVCVVPLFLFAAGHVKNDLPLVLAQARARCPGTRFDVSRALGVDPRMIDIAFARAENLLAADRAASTAVIVVGRGSSDPDANGDFCKLVRLLGEGRGLCWVIPSFIGVTAPLFEDALELLSRARPKRIVVLPYFLFTGRLIEKIDERIAAFGRAYSWIRVERTAPLDAHPKLFELIDERLREALENAAPLPCDTCLYKRPIGARTNEVGGMRALLYSARHLLTHNQAAPHVHAHLPLRKHVLVCGNVDCAARGSIELISALRRELREHVPDGSVRITRTACMGRCGEGPTVAVYPDGIWYRKVEVSDASELVFEHLVEDRLVARLVDNIMT